MADPFAKPNGKKTIEEIMKEKVAALQAASKPYVDQLSMVHLLLKVQKIWLVMLLLLISTLQWQG
jgi:hypothetical protein